MQDETQVNAAIGFYNKEQNSAMSLLELEGYVEVNISLSKQVLMTIMKTSLESRSCFDNDIQEKFFGIHSD